jgi:hypothetical protein
MKEKQKNPNFIRFCIVLTAAVLCMSYPVSAWDFNVNPISTNNYMDISTSNGGGYYVGFRNAGGGLNALHITTTTSDPYGQVTSVSSDSGTFYLADTGGRGYFDRAILMVAVKVPDGGEDEISKNLTVHLRASGYQWVSEGIKDQPPNEENITYVTDALNGKFGLSSVTYGPQSWKPPVRRGIPSCPGRAPRMNFTSSSSIRSGYPGQEQRDHRPDRQRHGKS